MSAVLPLAGEAPACRTPPDELSDTKPGADVVPGNTHPLVLRLSGETASSGISDVGSIADAAVSFRKPMSYHTGFALAPRLRRATQGVDLAA